MALKEQAGPKEVVTFEARASVFLNGRKQLIIGKGSIDLAAGIVDGNYYHDLPANDVDALIFQTVLITGYPSVCRRDGEYCNPFQEGDYSYLREIDFGLNGRMNYEATCWVAESNHGLCLQSEFEVQGEIDVPKLNGALPLIERWCPDGKEMVSSSFQIVWPTAGGKGYIKGDATTVYQPPKNAINITEPFLRNIAFRHARSTENCLEIIQESWLSREIPNER